ncbi:MAG: bifunctional phosphopantothenoylcysteine decarboxylase/phosphopantothenate--cysteine ligase CoaBC [Candidatus Kapabacteria bacterium]|nr:bifunctional phosphopantothenoylcysteine decarboxylase/phosphopantothenate--cysteine ligase CoaBC [Candidatus Kapabacteria bacterium]
MKSLILKDKKIIVGVTGSIAAYKIPLLVRELRKQGAEVYVVMTESSLNFVSPLVLSNLSKNSVITNMFEENFQTTGAWHIKLVHECDAMIIAPCSASTLGKIANGICENALTVLATALPNGIPLIISPAMDSTMFNNLAVQRNLQILKNDGVIIIPPESGELSSGLIGEGRMPEIDVLIAYITDSIEKKNSFNQKIKSESKPLAGKKVLVSAGPTIEKIDEVRFLSNFSSGKMGFAIAEHAFELGADVYLVTGPVNLKTDSRIHIRDVQSAEDMFCECFSLFQDMDITIMAAAVADFTPNEYFPGKIKKKSDSTNLNINLKLTKDILFELGKEKKDHQILVGFALESSNEVQNALVKIKEKNCDFIVINSANKPESGFGGDINTITILKYDGSLVEFPSMSKHECASNIFNVILK